MELNLQSSNINNYIIRGEVIQDIALGLIAKRQVPSERHDETSQHGNSSREMRDSCEAVHGRRFERAVNKKTVVMADEGKRDDADGLEYTIVNE